ncbi:MAG: phage terminase small subunit P27 family, partial [Sterolibacteriaceae bacterium]|nr:phage terminase small subunit P27 family [Sterolibacteriaceae bacterium]
EALSSDARKAHGLSPSFVVCDELAQWPRRDLFDNLVTGTGARDQPLVLVISTQSSDPNSVMSELVSHGRQVIAGTIEDPSFVAVIYAVPDDADPWDESLWPLANPALGDFRSLDEMRKFAERAKRIPSREAVFRNLYLNQAVAAEIRFIAAQDWKACSGTFDREVLQGRPCWAGLDLSSTTDLTALVLYFPLDGGAVLPFFWLPADNIKGREARDRVPYRIWEDQQLIELTPGRAIDKRVVARRLAPLLTEFDVKGIGYDRWRIQDLKTILTGEGIDAPLIELGQGFKDMGPALDALEIAVLDGQLRHGGNPVLTWNCSNAVVETDPAGNRKLNKARSIARIDGLVALAMAIGLYARREEQMELDLSNFTVLTV